MKKEFSKGFFFGAKKEATVELTGKKALVPAIVLFVVCLVGIVVGMYFLMQSENKKSVDDQTSGFESTDMPATQITFDSFGFQIFFPTFLNRDYFSETKEYSQHPIMPHIIVYFSIDAAGTTWLSEQYEFAHVRVVPIDVWDKHVEVLPSALAVVKNMEDGPEKYLGTYLGKNNVYAFVYQSNSQDCPGVVSEGESFEESELCFLMRESNMITDTFSIFDVDTEATNQGL